MLEKHAGQVVLANSNDTPEPLYRTRVLAAGSLCYRNIRAVHAPARRLEQPAGRYGAGCGLPRPVWLHRLEAGPHSGYILSEIPPSHQPTR
jgi:hypothetical protein